MTGPFKVFPPKYGNVLLPTSSRRASLSGLAMYAPSKWTGVWLQRLAWIGIQIFGPSVLPTKRVRAPIEDHASWRELLEAWSEQFGQFEEVAIHRPRDPHRKGFSVLLMSGGRPQTFLKVVKLSEVAVLAREELAQEAIWRFQPRWFRAMEPIGLSEASGWAFLATRTLEGAMHRPPRTPPLMEIVAEIQSGLSNLPKPVAIPDHWVPIHGDFTPWNLRRLRSGELVLLDWEEARWGPPGSDMVLYEAASTVLNGSKQSVALRNPAFDEARSFWIAHWSTRVNRQRDLGGSVEELAMAVRLCRILDTPSTPG